MTNHLFCRERLLSKVASDRIFSWLNQRTPFSRSTQFRPHRRTCCVSNNLSRQSLPFVRILPYWATGIGAIVVWSSAAGQSLDSVLPRLQPYARSVIDTTEALNSEKYQTYLNCYPAERQRYTKTREDFWLEADSYRSYSKRADEKANQAFEEAVGGSIYAEADADASRHRVDEADRHFENAVGDANDLEKQKREIDDRISSGWTPPSPEQLALARQQEAIATVTWRGRPSTPVSAGKHCLPCL
jgi:hypothetical protein